MPEVVSWIGEPAIGLGAATSVSTANVAAVDALLYLGQREQEFTRLQTLHAQYHGICRNSGEQLTDQHGMEGTISATGQLDQLGADAKQDKDCHGTSRQCLWLATPPPKLDKHGLERQLPAALRFISIQREHGRSVLICDDAGVDACVCVALAAILCRVLYDEGCAARSTGRVMSAVVHGVKAAARTELASISRFHIDAQPSRTALKQVYSFVSRKVASQELRSGTSAT